MPDSITHPTEKYPNKISTKESGYFDKAKVIYDDKNPANEKNNGNFGSLNYIESSFEGDVIEDAKISQDKNYKGIDEIPGREGSDIYFETYSESSKFGPSINDSYPEDVGFGPSSNKSYHESSGYGTTINGSYRQGASAQTCLFDHQQLNMSAFEYSYRTETWREITWKESLKVRLGDM